MDAASASERISRLNEVIPIEQGLSEAGFVETPPLATFTWDDRGLSIVAVEGWPYGWTLLATAHTPRTALCDEFRLPGQIARGRLLARLLRCWRVFRAEPAPEAWQDGLLWEQFQEEMRRLSEKTTMRLHADTSFLRLTVNRIKEAWSEREIGLGFVPGQLVVVGGDVEYHVPAYGHWLGWCKVQSSALLEALPVRFPARSTPIAYAEGVLTIAYQPVPASWAEGD